MGRDLRLGAAVRDGLGNAGVHVANDPTRRLLSSCTGPLRGCDPGLVVGLGAGAALAVTVGGRVAQNAHGAAGEVAYGPISAGAFEGIGSILEEVASDFPRESARPGGRCSLRRGRFGSPPLLGEEHDDGGAFGPPW